MIQKSLVTLLLLLILGSLADVKAQILIGLNRNEITSFISKHKPDYELVEMAFEDKKYGVPISYKDRTRMLVYILGEDGICHTFLQFYNYSYLNETINGFNKHYVKHGEWEWLDHKEGVTYKYRIEKGEGSFLVVANEYKAD